MKYIQILIVLLVIGFGLEVKSQMFLEKVIVQHDKPYYFAGDEMQLALYLTGNDLVQNNESELVYIDLIDKYNKYIFEGSLLTKGRCGNASIKLGNNLADGYYELVAYTNRMRNFGEQSFFRKRIAVFNGSPLSSDNSKLIKLDAVVEGGQLVDGITNRVIVHATDSYGEGIATKVTLVADGKEITTFLCDSFGFGTFYFTPDQNKQYNLVTEEGVIKHDILPVIKDTGTALTVRNLKEATQLILQTNEKSELNYRVEVRSQDEVLYATEHSVKKNKPLLITLKSNSLQNKILDVVIIDENDSIVNYRPFTTFVQGDSIDTKLTVVNKEIKPGEKIELEIAASTNLLSLSILDDVYSNKLVTDPFAEVYFDSNLMDKCVLASIPVSNILGTSTFDNLLFFKSTYPVPVSNKFEQEQYLYLKGRLTDTKPLPDTTKLLFYISGINVAYQTTTDSTGLFGFPLLFDFHGKEKVMFVPLNEEHKFENPQIQQSITVSHKLDLNLPLKMDSVILNQMIEQRDLLKISNVYNYSNEAGDMDDRLFQIENIFSVYERDIKMNEYVPFKSMEEVIKEILPGVQLRHKGKTKTLRIYSNELAKNFEGSPLIFINNNPIVNIEDLLSIDPDDIESIKVVTSLGELNKIGSFAQNGVIILTTKNNAENKYMDGNSFEAAGLLSLTLLEKPMPDFRDVLYSNFIHNENKTNTMKILSSYRPGTYVVKIKTIGGLIPHVLTQKIEITR